MLALYAAARDLGSVAARSSLRQETGVQEPGEAEFLPRIKYGAGFSPE